MGWLSFLQLQSLHLLSNNNPKVLVWVHLAVISATSEALPTLMAYCFNYLAEFVAKTWDLFPLKLRSIGDNDDQQF